MTVDTYALLDGGSTISLINRSLMRDAGVRGPKSQITLRGVSPREIVFTKCEKVSLELHTDSGKWQIEHVVAVPDLQLPSQSLPPELAEFVRQREGVCIRSYSNVQPKLLLGQDNWQLIETRELREVEDSGLAVSRTLLGWTVHGRKSVETLKVLCDSASSQICATVEGCGAECVDPNNNLDELIRRYFLVDNLGANGPAKVEPNETRARRILEQTTRNLGKVWETGLLWKSESIPQVDSRVTAKNRLRLLERKLDRDKEYAELYYAEMDRFISEGYAVQVEMEIQRPRLWYLPHFGVRNINKPGRLRLVFDAAAKTNGICLNDQLETGPDLLQPLPGILIRFRQYAIAIKGDIKDMFLRVRVNETDRGAQRFLWRGSDRKTEPKIYEMSCLVFGSKSSPCSAIFVKNQNASRYANSSPDAAKSIVVDSYMDDFLTSRKTVNEAKALIREVTRINAEANFLMHGWASNDARVLRTSNEESEEIAWDRALLCDSGGERVLGLYWDRRTDELGFNVGFAKIPENILTGTARPTKREFLRIAMSVFDPLGFLSPLTLKAKLLMQDIWRSGIGWDASLKDEQYAGWRTWLENLSDIRDCRIPRCLTPSRAAIEDVQLHTFCDASLSAYAAAVYLRFSIKNAPARMALVMAKARVAPVKPTTVPRLELQAALLGSRIAKTVGDELEIETSRRYFWSDSTTVLRWIESDPRSKQVFVANRLGEIGELSKNCEWRWVPSGMNPADDATRWTGCSLSACDRWFTGPAFLSQEEPMWPKEKALSPREKESIDNSEWRKAFVCVASATTPNVPITAKLLGWNGLQIVARRVRKAFDRWRQRSRAIDGEEIREITGIDCIINSEEYWFREIQSDCFPEEIDALRNRKQLLKNSKVISMNPFLDERGILRAHGRVTTVMELEFENNPIILDARHFATKCLIAAYHRKFFHANKETVVNELVQKFHIIGLRTKLRSIISRCIACRIRRGKPQNPPMAALPRGRVAYRHRPFSHCGVDYFGPMNVKIGRRREKRWGVLFTCLTTRAIHLELAHSLTASSAIMALQRLAARRGSPSNLYSDNGTNFRRASKELLDAVANIDRAEQERYAVAQRIRWHFNPPDAPHMGGAWERLVKSVKIALSATLHEDAPSEEVLYTLLTEVEHTVNSRPLTNVSVDPRDEEALTPNHFLIGNSSGGVILDRYEAEIVNPRKQFRLAQRYADKFWEKWLREYLPTLLPRKKWNSSEDPLRIGDIVLIMDLLAPRNTWQKGKVIEVYPGTDGVVRVAKLRTSKNKDLMRPVRKLIKILGSDEV